MRTPRSCASSPADEAGFALGIAAMIFMMLITLYTCTLVVKNGDGGSLNGEAVEFSDVVRCVCWVCPDWSLSATIPSSRSGARPTNATGSDFYMSELS